MGDVRFGMADDGRRTLWVLAANWGTSGRVYCRKHMIQDWTYEVITEEVNVREMCGVFLRYLFKSEPYLQMIN